MKKSLLKKATPVILLAATSTSPLCLASDNLYAGVAYSPVTYELSVGTSSIDFSHGSLSGYVGSPISDKVAIEGRFVLGMGSDQMSSGSTTLEYQTNRILAAHAVGTHKLSPDFAINGRLGLALVTATGKVSTSTQYAEETNTESDLSYGFGAKYQINTRTDLAFDYISYYSDTIDGVSEDIYSTNFGVTFKI